MECKQVKGKLKTQSLHIIAKENGKVQIPYNIKFRNFLSSPSLEMVTLTNVVFRFVLQREGYQSITHITGGR